MPNRRLVSVAAVSTSGTAYTGRADGMFSTNDQAKLKQAGVWPTAIAAPSAPTAASATAGNLQATVSFTTPSSLNGETIISYTVTSSPGSVTANGASSPITVSGLTGGTSYTFTVVANTASGASLSSSASSSITIVAITYSDEVFSTYLYNGNGSTQTINNSINLAGQGGMVWVKYRSQSSNNYIVDTVRGAGDTLNTNTTSGASADSIVTNFSSTGFTAGTGGSQLAQPLVSWTFRKANKFFDIMTYTGDGVFCRFLPWPSTITDSTIGAVLIKRVNSGSSGDWIYWHRDFSWSYMTLNSTGAKGNATIVNGGTGSNGLYINDIANTNSAAYVAYLFAHDTSPTGNIQCGSLTSGSDYSEVPVTLGWEPQFILIKSSSGVGGWWMVDNMRQLNANNNDQFLSPNTVAAESSLQRFKITSTGFTFVPGAPTTTYIYIAIRRPNKPPISGTQVYKGIAWTGTGAAATVTGVGFAPDIMISVSRVGVWGAFINDRLRGPSQQLAPYITNAEWTAATAVTGFTMDGATLGADASVNSTVNSATYIHHFFKRAPGFMDVVCYSASTATPLLITHNLGVKPQFVIEKKRSAGQDWFAWHTLSTTINQGYLNATNSFGGNGGLTNNTTSTVFSSITSGESGTYVAYLFATLAGISKVGSYTGNGSSQTIDCGFTSGARFILIKCTSAVGDWYIWDTARGITASANDPHLSLNTTAAEVTTDNSIDPANSGFIAIQNATTNINVTSATYIFLAIA